MKRQKKSIREKGKIKLSRMFQKLKEGDKVCLARDLSTRSGRTFPRRMEGKTGTIQKKQGQAYVVKVKDYNAVKTFIIKPIHLKKLK
jgi:large subunit ribosomal protein L21e